jgi:hypothetical protein
MKAKMLSSLVLMAVAASLAGMAQAQPAGEEILQIVGIDGIPLREAVTMLAKQANLNIQIDPALLDQYPGDLHEKWKNVTALQALLDNYGWLMTQSPGSITRISAKTSNVFGPQRIIVNLSENAQTNGTAGDQAAPVMALSAVPLTDAVRALALQAGLNIQFDPRLANLKDAPNVTEKWRNVTARQAMQALLDNYDWHMTQIPGNPIFRIGARNTKAVGALGTKVNLLENSRKSGAAVEEVSPEIAFDGAPLGDAIRALALQAGLNVLFDPRLANRQNVKVTEKWKNLTARQGLQVLLDIPGWEVTQIPGNPIFRIVAKNPQD